MANNKEFKFRHIINGVWGLSMVDDLKIFFTYLNTLSIHHAYSFIIIIILSSSILTLCHQYFELNEFSIIFIYCLLATINFVSVIMGVYATMLLIPDIITWTSRICIILLLVCLILTQLINLSTAYYQTPTIYYLLILHDWFNWLICTEDIYFLGLYTHLFFLQLALPLHLSVTVLTLTVIFFVITTALFLAFNQTAIEAYQKKDFKVLVMITIEAMVKTFTCITLFGCIFFNVALIPVIGYEFSVILSFMLTGLFTFLYYNTEASYLFVLDKINLQKGNAPKDSDGFNHPSQERHQSGTQSHESQRSSSLFSDPSSQTSMGKDFLSEGTAPEAPPVVNVG